MKLMRKFTHILLVVAILTGTASCSFFDTTPTPRGWEEGGARERGRIEPETRTISEPVRKVMILYSAGFNSLHNYLKEDQADLREGYIPGRMIKDDVLLVFSHLCNKAYDYKTPTSPVLYRLTKDNEGKVVADTLLRLAAGTPVATKETLAEVLRYVKIHFPAKSYGMIFSSHASGWLPPGYYSSPEEEYSNTIAWNAPRRRPAAYGSGPVPYSWPEWDEGPAVKSVGQEQIGSDSYELTLREFAEAFPMHFDYILIDACLMGGAEVAYTFKDICDQVGFSQAEVLAEGFNYKTLTSHLLAPETPDPVSVCSDYFEYYNARSGSFRSATISVIRTDGMDRLAAVCKTLFAKYAAEMAAVNPKSIQNFGRNVGGYDHGWYFDLKDILAKSGATEEDLATLQEALDGCVVYKAATPVLLGSIPINAFSGLTMHLPAFGTPYLNEYYRDNVSWNDATELIP